MFFLLLFTFFASAAFAWIEGDLGGGGGIKQSLPNTGACYWPDGTTANGLAGCYDTTHNGYAGFCCKIDDFCLANGVCQEKPANPDPRREKAYYRGGCMDINWGFGNCSQICIDSDLKSATHLSRCGGGGTKWYCEDHAPIGGADCLTFSGTFDLPDNTTAFATAGWSIPGESPSSTSPVESTTQASLVKTTQTSAPTSIASTSDPAASVSTTAFPQDSASTASPKDVLTTIASSSAAVPVQNASASESILPPNSAEGEDEGGHAIPIGVGVGIGAVVLIAIGTLAFLYVRKRRLEAPIRAETPPPLDASDKDSVKYSATIPMSALKISYSGFSGGLQAPCRQPTIPALPVIQGISVSTRPAGGSQAAQTRWCELP